MMLGAPAVTKWGRAKVMFALASADRLGHELMLERLNAIFEGMPLTPEQAREVSLEIRERRRLLAAARRQCKLSSAIASARRREAPTA